MDTPVSPQDPRQRLRTGLCRLGILTEDDTDLIALFYRDLARRLGETLRQRLGEHGMVELLDAHATGRAGFDEWRQRAVPDHATLAADTVAAMLRELGRPRACTLRNLTGHPVVLHTPRAVVRVEPTDIPARCTDEDTAGTPPGVITAADATIVLAEDSTGSHVRNLPPAQHGILLIVSRVVAYAQPERTDLVFPYGPIRDSSGQTRGCRALACTRYRARNQRGYRTPE